MKREDDQELWDLLGKRTTPAVSPFFARNVMRQVREAGRRQRFFVQWLRPRILASAAAGLLALALSGIALQHRIHEKSFDDPPDVVAAVDPQDYEVVADLDDLIAMEDDSPWDDETQSL